MAGTSPIQLGSAVSGWTFEAASSVEESASGIQTCTVSALWPDGSTVLSNLPAAGASVSTIDSTGYVPSSFLLDYSEAGPNVDYIEGRIARVKFKFKRQDPNRIGRTFAIVKSDSVINYQSSLNASSLTFVAYSGGGSATSGLESFGNLGFPEPIASLFYNSTTQPGIGSGGLSQIYAQPGSADAQGFPAVPIISFPLSVIVGPGGTATYYDPSAIPPGFVAVGPVIVQTQLNFTNEYRPNVLGWQLQKIKAKAIAGGAFYDAEEEWRIFYVGYGSVLVSAIPPLPPP